MRIIGLGSALPERTVNNHELSRFLDTSDEWIITRTGIRERRILSQEKLEDLAVKAAQNALEDAGLSPSDLDYIICSNVYSAYITPGLGCVVQGLLGAQCPVVDINAACVGFIYGLQMAQGLLKTGCKRVMVLCAEAMSRMVDWRDRSTCVLFGDGSAAAILEGEGSDGVFKMGVVSNLEVLSATNSPGNSPFTTAQMEEGHGVHMQGQEVFKFAVSSSVRDIQFLLEKTGISAADIKYYLLHQANLRIVDAVKKRLGLGEENCPANVQQFGNTSSVSVPLLLNQVKGSLKSGDKLVLSAFGAGLTTGAVLLSW